MKDIKTLVLDLEKMSNNLIPNLIRAEQNTAEHIKGMAQTLAPRQYGVYASSIKANPTVQEGNTLKTTIGSDLMVYTKSGQAYNLGFLLETGTDPHAIPNAFGWGDIYGYDSEQYQRTLSPDWHPGTVAHIHYGTALASSKSLREINIRNAIRESFK